jgi:2-polyprenyl-3-methyl-5-hydroxy-6-metoxy-1,4-benzoquinol methylase
MINVNCYNCNSSESKLYATENGCNLVKCDHCGLLYVNPRLRDDEIDEGVKLGVHSGDNTLNSTGRYMATKVAIYRTILPDLYGNELASRKATWLDVGCGHGELLVALRELCGDNVEALGIEPNRLKIPAARLRGLNVDYFDLASHHRKYDTISLLNVFSHVPNPREFLQLVRQRLTPRGEILLETGDTANLRADQHPRPFLLPDHLSFTSAEILSNILKHVGFEIINIKKYPDLKLRFIIGTLPKDIVKLFLPKKGTYLKSLPALLRANKYRTDMWIRARVVN